MNQMIQNLLNMLIQRNPNIANNPRNKAMLEAIQNGDSVKGEQLANNLCQSYGVTREQALAQAKQYFHI